MDEKDILRRLKEEGERIEIPEELRPERIEKMLESVKEMQKTWEGDETIEQQTLAPKNRKWHRYTAINLGSQIVRQSQCRRTTAVIRHLMQWNRRRKTAHPLVPFQLQR